MHTAEGSSPSNPVLAVEVVEEREAGGWWAGRLDGRLGWFPSSFCRIHDSDDAPGSASSASASPASADAKKLTAPSLAPPSSAALVPPLQPQPSASSTGSAARSSASYSDFELPLTSAAVSTATAAARKSGSSGDFLGGLRSSSYEASATVDGSGGFAASMGDFVGGSCGISGTSALDKRLQSVQLPSRMATDPKAHNAPTPAPASGGYE